MVAAEIGAEWAFATICRNGPDVHRRGAINKTALHFAAKFEN